MIPASAPAGALRTSALASILPALAIGGAAALVLQETAALGTGYPWRAVALLVAGAALLFAGLDAHLPQREFGAANRVTLARAVMVVLLLAMAGETRIPAVTAFAIAVVAATLDIVDGRLARGRGISSPFGARFDMETDALLILALSLLLWLGGKLGPWVLAAGLLRPAFALARAMTPRLRVELAPSRRRRAMAVVLVVSLLTAFAPFVPPLPAAVAAAIGLTCVAASFAADLVASWRAGSKRA